MATIGWRNLDRSWGKREMKRAHKYTAALSFTLVFVGCSTHQAALDQANNGATLLTLYQAQLGRLMALQDRLARQRLDSVRRQEIEIEQTNKQLRHTLRLESEAGATEYVQIARKIDIIVDGLKSDEEFTHKLANDLDALSTSVVEPIVIPVAEMDSIRQALLELGKQIPIEQRIHFAAEYARQVRDAANEAAKRADSVANPKLPDSGASTN
jgi:hypothetical protein